MKNWLANCIFDIFEIKIFYFRYEITGLTSGAISDFTKTIVMGEGESQSEESIKCGPQCDSDGNFQNHDERKKCFTKIKIVTKTFLNFLCFCCHLEGLLAALVDEVDKTNAQNFLFIRAGSSKRIILKLRDGTKLGGPVLGILFFFFKTFIFVLKSNFLATKKFF